MLALTTLDCSSLDSNQMNNAAQVPTFVSQPYPAVGPIISPYEDPTPVKDLNKYTTLKAVGKKLFTTTQKKMIKHLKFIIWFD